MTDGFEQVKALLERLPDTIQDKVLEGAGRAAATVIANEARRLVPVRSGLLKKSIKVRKPKKKDDTHKVRYLVVTTSKIAGSSKFDSALLGAGTIRWSASAFYAHMVEFGTSKMAAQPFMTPAFESKGEASTQVFIEYAKKRTQKEIDKLGLS